MGSRTMGEVEEAHHLWRGFWFGDGDDKCGLV